jgi:hypothetical protein
MDGDSDRNPHKAERTGEYVQITRAHRLMRGTLAEGRIENGRLEYLLRLDPRFDTSGIRHPFYVLESEVEPCDRPTDAEVQTIQLDLKGRGRS